MTLDQAAKRAVVEQEAPLLRAAASQISSACKSHGYMEIHAFPDLDSLLAASIAFSVLRRNGVDVVVYASPLPPQKVSEPSLLIGYPPQVADTIDAKLPIVLIGPGERPKGLSRITVVARLDSSVSALTASVLSEIAVVGDSAVYAIVSGYWKGMDAGRRAEFLGLEASLIDSLQVEGKIEGQLTVRLFRWFELPIEEAIAATFDPFLPGYTGHPDEALKLLREDPRTSKLAGQRVVDVSEELLAVLAEKLYNYLKSVSKLPRRPSELIGYTYMSPILLAKDLRELGYMLQVLLEKRGVSMIVSTSLGPRPVQAQAMYWYSREFNRMVKTIEEKAWNDMDVGFLRLSVAPEDTALLPVEKQARLLGLLRGRILAAEHKGELVTTLESIVREYGFPRLVSAMEAGCLEYIEDTCYVAIRKTRCM